MKPAVPHSGTIENDTYLVAFHSANSMQHLRASVELMFANPKKYLGAERRWREPTKQEELDFITERALRIDVAWGTGSALVASTESPHKLVEKYLIVYFFATLKTRDAVEHKLRFY